MMEAVWQGSEGIWGESYHTLHADHKIKILDQPIAVGNDVVCWAYGIRSASVSYTEIIFMPALRASAIIPLTALVV